MTLLEFSVTTAELGGDAFVITVTGEADLHTAPEIERALEGVIGLGGSSAVVDLDAVSFVDSTALAALHRYHPQFKARGGEFVIVTQDRRVLKTFEITGLDRVFTIEQNLAQGVAAVMAVSAAADRVRPKRR